jgi:Radical SAM superfamily
MTPTASVPPARRNVHLVEFTMLFENRYSATLGYLQAAAQAEPDLAAALTFHRHIGPHSADVFERECAAILAAMDDPLVAAFTIFFWNRAASLELARRIKDRWPACRIVIGGNDVTNQQDAVFAEAPWVDVLVHGEGELRFRELLRRFLHTGPDDVHDIAGISYRSASGQVMTTPPADRIADLAEVPSPILSPVFSDADIAVTRVLIFETNRGCPYSCAFCYWGGAINSKVRQFPIERIAAELDRIIRLAQPGTQLFIADANFGIVPRDADIARLIIETCRRYGKRIVVLTNWAKNTTDRVVEIAHQLYSAGLVGAITLSAQSFDPEVLQIANRSNIRVKTYRKMQERFRELDVPTYTDLIWGLPGETPASFHAGIEEVLTAGGCPKIYPLLLLNNTEYTKDRFRSDYLLEARRLPCQPGMDELIADVIVSHSAMSHGEWLDGLMLSLSLCLFQKALLRCTLRLLAHHCGARTVDLLQRLVRYLDTACGDPEIVALARNYTQSWRNPADFDRPRVTQEIGPMMIREELHYQAILARMVRDPGYLRDLAGEAVDYLAAGLGDATVPPRAELDAVIGLDLAGAAAFRAGLTGRTEENAFCISADALALLQTCRDVPAKLDVPEGTLAVPPSRTRYPFTAYSLSVWHGAGRPLHDLTLSMPRQRKVLEPV